MKNEQKKILKDNEVLVDNFKVMKNKLRKVILIGTILYAILVLYFMFGGFNRIDHKSAQHVFMFVPERVPLMFPKLTMSWLFDFGNIAAFIPFGIAVPLLYHIRFRKFITLFISVIFFFEVLQALTLLGSFDIMDILSNTLGAIIGFVGYRVGFPSKITFKKLVASAVSILILIIGVMVISETIDYGVNVNKKIGPIEVLKEISTSAPITKDFSTFAVNGENVQLQFNLFSSEDRMSKEYSFNVSKKNIWLYAKCGIPDNEEHKGSVTIMINGEVVFEDTFSDKDEGIVRVDPFFEQKIEDVKIIVTGNAKVWDVSIAELKHWWE